MKYLPQVAQSVKNVEAKSQKILGDLFNFKGRINPKDRFGRFTPDGCLNEFMGAAWAQRTYDYIEEFMKNSDPPNEPWFMGPIALYQHKTGTDRGMRHGMEPVLAMILILNRKARNNDRCKRVLGYLPDLDLKSSATKQRDNQNIEGKGRSIRNYHKVIIDNVAENQGFTKHIVLPLHIGDQVKRVRMFFPVACCLGDLKNGDTLTGRYGVQ